MKTLKGLMLGLGLLCMAFPAMAVEFGDDLFGGVTVHGFISQGYLKSDNNNFFAKTEDGSARFNEFGVNISSQVSDQLRVGLQILGRNLGEFGEGDPEIDWAFADYRWRDWMGLRVGKMKMVHGLYNTTRDIDMLRTSIFLPQSVYNEAWRDTVSSITGAEVYGDIYMGNAGSLTYQFQGGEADFPTDGGVVATLKDQAKLEGNRADPRSTHTKHSYAGGLVWSTPVNGLRLSTTGWIVEFDTDADLYLGGSGQILDFRANTISKAYTASLEYIFGSFTFAAEYMGNRYEFSNNLVNQTNTLNTEGYYAAMGYRFTDWLEMGLSYSEYYADKDDRDGNKNKTDQNRIAAGYKDHDAWLKDLALTARFDLTPNWVFKLEGHAMNGAAILMKDINSENNILNTSENWFLFAAKMTVSF
ncbi:porin [Desulfobotulus sp. H1]|uniref:Porin n=1 Tax=Desulfobotulus pelophilus TaxID=2823377 RepID=A0ABT3NCD5_9BACT|nr:porin [Desulfobotulus pelophilus]MCW7755140.1 porin [Desulfobotulus pelophilus]